MKLLTTSINRRLSETSGARIDFESRTSAYALSQLLFAYARLLPMLDFDDASSCFVFMVETASVHSELDIRVPGEH